MFLTHLHGDPFGGLPFLILDAQLVSLRTVITPMSTDMLSKAGRVECDTADDGKIFEV
ncbi:MAG TPA: hypothetical protein PKN59_06635 [Syntrophales bacterium]|nr:hypothetical protein [Syntrophales bacterium]